MEVLYSKVAQGRKPQYQIITKIVLMNGERHVLKEAACAEAADHIENTFHNEELLAPVYGDCLVQGRLQDGRLFTPYVEGETMGSRLRGCLGEKNEEEKSRELLRQWRELLIGKEENVCRFVPSKAFEDVFGKADDLTGADATVVSNFDCSSENIFFMEDGRIKIIDYEWVFPFPVPVELSFYRVLKQFYEGNQGLIDWEKLLGLSEIDRNQYERYEQLADAFAEYTALDREKHIHYGLMGKKFKTGKILGSGRNVFFYRFPYELIPAGKRVVLYGAGRVGEDYHKMIGMTDYCQLAAWTDKSAALYRKQGLDVADVETAMHSIYDYVLIAVAQEKVAEEIREELLAYGINSDKIVWGSPRLL